jgi:hypothetical protein
MIQGGSVAKWLAHLPSVSEAVGSSLSELDVYDVDIRRHKHDQLRCL